MKKEIINYIIVYLLIYLILSLIYGGIQRFLICTDMYGFDCAFSEVKILAFSQFLVMC